MRRLTIAILSACLLAVAATGTAAAEHTVESTTGQRVTLEHSGPVVQVAVFRPNGTRVTVLDMEITATQVNTGQVTHVRGTTIVLAPGTYDIQIVIHKKAPWRRFNERALFEDVRIGS